MTGPSSSPRGERPGKPGVTWEQQLARAQRVACDHLDDGPLTRVQALAERWVKAGPPPLGVTLARWWDMRLAELHDAIQPTGKEQ